MKKINTITSLGLVTAMVVTLMGPFVEIAEATVTNSSDAMSRLGLSDGTPIVLSDHAIQFTTSLGVGSAQTIVITFPSDFDGSTTGDSTGPLDFSDVDLFEDTTPDGVCDGSAETLVASGATTAQWNAVFSGTENRILTLTSGGASAIIVAASQVCVMIGENAVGGTANSQYENPTTGGSKVITVVAGSEASNNITVNILTDDQVAVTATVDQSITFSISDNTIGFGSLSASAACFAQGTAGCSGSEVEAHNLIVGTNAGSGYSMTINGNTLTSGAFTIATTSANTASTIGSEQFGLRMTATGGSGTVSVPYAAAGYAFDSLNFPDQVAASTVASANTTYSVRYIANIDSATEAGAYTSTLTYVATANF
ncbi:hypothetical protein EXS57_01085 [Candidatus Kaiserbacteria bacterium]|nr:hypothetical protein [Candidatus Kaiserbacteria bacterium]